MGCIECLMFLHTTYLCDKFNLSFSILYPHLKNNIEHISESFEHHGYLYIYVYIYVNTQQYAHSNV